MKILFFLFVVPFLLIPAFSENSQVLPTEKGTLDVDFSTEPSEPAPNEVIKLKIDFINPFTNRIQEHIDYIVTVSKDDKNIFGPIPLTHTSSGSVKIPVQTQDEGLYVALIEISGILFQPIPPETVSFNFVVGDIKTNSGVCEPGTKLVEGVCKIVKEPNGGGCLIATAAFGTELAPQVQKLREIRDNTLLETNSGSAFMTGFNEFYYSFSPTIADWERQNPTFKEAVKLLITPLLTSLSILNHVDIDSEASMLGYGIGIIMMNVGMYFIAPIIAIIKLKKRFHYI
ncbi:MAG: copper-binding protein [Thaumarchaeota archaeon]|nr:copper-binding protein [Nitrososphaerota archaeon]